MCHILKSVKLATWTMRVFRVLSTREWSLLKKSTVKILKFDAKQVDAKKNGVEPRSFFKDSWS